MNDFLTFRKMITPMIIQVLFWIGAVVSVIAGIIMIIGGASSPYGGGAAVLTGLLLLVLGPLAVRIYCELLIILFRMNETLTEIKNNSDHANLASQGTEE